MDKVRQEPCPQETLARNDLKPESLEALRRSILNRDHEDQTVFDFHLSIKTYVQSDRLMKVYKEAVLDSFPWFNLETPSVFCESKTKVERRVAPPPTADHCYCDSSKSATSDTKKVIRTMATKSKMASVFSSSSDSLVCSLCSEGADLIRGRLLPVRSDEWVHVACALFSSEVNEDSKGGLINVVSAMQRGLKTTCVHCGQRGATIACYESECDAIFHFKCALESQAKVELHQVLCRQHNRGLRESDPRRSELEDSSPLRASLYQRRLVVDMNGVKASKDVSKDAYRQMTFHVGALSVLQLGRRVRGISDEAVKQNILDVPVDFQSSRLYWSCAQPLKVVRYFCRTRMVERRPRSQEINVVVEAGQEDEERVLKETQRELRRQELGEMMKKRSNLLPPDAFKMIWPHLQLHEDPANVHQSTSIVDLDDFVQQTMLSKEEELDKGHSHDSRCNGRSLESSVVSPGRRLNKAVSNVLSLRRSPFKQKLSASVQKSDDDDDDDDPENVNDSIVSEEFEVVRTWFNLHKGKRVREVRTHCLLPFVHTNRELDDWPVRSMSDDDNVNNNVEDDFKVDDQYDDVASSSSETHFSDLFFSEEPKTLDALLNLPQEKLLAESHKLLSLDTFNDELDKDDFNDESDEFTLDLTPENCILQLDGHDDSESNKKFSIHHLLSPGSRRGVDEDDDDVVVLPSPRPSTQRPLLPKPESVWNNVNNARLQYVTNMSGPSTMNSNMPTFQFLPSSNVALNPSMPIWNASPLTFSMSQRPLMQPWMSLQQQSLTQYPLMHSSFQQQATMRPMGMPLQVPSQHLMPPLVPSGQRQQSLRATTMSQPLIFNSPVSQPFVSSDHLGHRKVARVQPLSKVKTMDNKVSLDEKGDSSLAMSHEQRTKAATKGLRKSKALTSTVTTTMMTKVSESVGTLSTTSVALPKLIPCIPKILPRTTGCSTTTTTSATATPGSAVQCSMKSSSSSFSEIEIVMEQCSSTKGGLKVSKVSKTGSVAPKSVQTAVTQLRSSVGRGRQRGSRVARKRATASFIAFPNTESLINQFEVEKEEDKSHIWHPTLNNSECPTVSEESRIMYELRAEDGSFQSESNDPSALWLQVYQAVSEARRQRDDVAEGNKEDVDVAEVGNKPDGFEMMGLAHAAIALLLQQVPWEDESGRLEETSKDNEKESNDDVELRGSVSGAARCDAFRERRAFDMFGWLASRHRRRPHPNVGLPLNDECALETSHGFRRSLSLTLPISTRFRQLPKRAREHVAVYRSAIHGRGIFCKKALQAGDMVIEYAGERIRAVLTDKRERQYQAKGIGCYMFRLDDNTVIDATLKGNSARFINHSCDPNCYSKIIDVLGRKHIVIFALRSILPGEELTYDYKFPIEDVKIPCTCGAKKCRKHMN